MDRFLLQAQLERARRRNFQRLMFEEMLLTRFHEAYQQEEDVCEDDDETEEHEDKSRIRASGKGLQDKNDHGSTERHETEPRQSDKSKEMWGSPEGKKLRSKADHIKSCGNQALKDTNYELAIGFYTDALKTAVNVRNNDEQLATLFSNRSLAHAKVKCFEDAIRDAENCIKLRPTWLKGFVRLMNGHKGLGDTQTAYDVGIDVFSKADMSKEEELQIFTEVLSLMPYVKDPGKMMTLTIPERTWEKGLHKLVKQKSWNVVSFLVMGKDGGPPILTAGTYKTVGLHISDLLTSCSEADWKEWGQRTAILLLQAGVKMDHISKEGTPAAHAALRVGMRTGVYDLLKHLFLRYIPMGDRDRADEEGNTLLHVACSDNYPTKLTAIKFLLDHNVNPTCRNKLNQRPLDLMASDDAQRNKVIQAMTDKGFELSAIMSQSPTPSSQNAKTTSATTTEGQVSQSSLKPKQFEETTTPRVGLVAEPSCKSSPLFNSQARTKECEKWTKSEVEKWMKENNLTGLADKLSALNGSQLMELHLLQLHTPAAFYQLLHTQLQLPLAQLLQLSAAVRILK